LFGETKVVGKPSVRKFEAQGGNTASSQMDETRNELIYAWAG